MVHGSYQTWGALVAETTPHLPGLPPSLAREVLHHLGGHPLARRDTTARQFGGGGGCTDPFSIFAFLAFALAVADLIMEMNKKRCRCLRLCSS